MKTYQILFLGAFIYMASCGETAPLEEQSYVIQYPMTEKGEVTDDYHGTTVADPYRWLEDDQSDATAAWVTAQNKVTYAYLERIPYRAKLKERLEQIWNYPKYSAPYKKGERYYFRKNDGLQNQSVLYYQEGLDGEPYVFIDPNTWSEDGTVSLGSVSYSMDAQHCAYTVSTAGSDWKEIHMMNVQTMEKLDDPLQWVKFSGISWHGEGFYYSRYNKPEEGGELSKKNEFHKVYYHKLGTAQSEDELVYDDPEHALRNFHISTTEDESIMVLYAKEGTSGNMLMCRSAENGKKWITIADDFESDIWVIGNVGDDIYILTNKDAPRKRLFKTTLANPGKWTDVLPEQQENILQSVSLVGGHITARYMKDASSQLAVYNLDGEHQNDIELPAIGRAGGFGGKQTDSITFYTFTSFTYPTSIYQYNTNSNTSTLFRTSEVDFDAALYETKQVFFGSKDGTQIPMFIVHKKGIKLNGNNPTMLYGYGGFNISKLPNFSASRLMLLEAGGVYAAVNLRGGGEYGEEWHKAGMLHKKQNVFDDFIAAAEYLIAEKYTSSERLAISGRSNGGLLVGVAMTQRPDLFKVAFPSVGVMDMLRYHRFTIGWAWAVEYGNADSSEHFANLYAYSPLHNLKAGTVYPATMITTADHDDRVVPAHSFKFAATLQEMHIGDNPVLIRIETKAGHGSGKPTSKRIEEAADMWSFMFYNMGIKWVETQGDVMAKAE